VDVPLLERFSKSFLHKTQTEMKGTKKIAIRKHHYEFLAGFEP
jgi:hypothetical protein